MIGYNSVVLSPPIDRECLVDASRPRYEVIAEEFRLAIRSGALEVGQRLPTFRELASHLDVSVTTVAGAYEMLRREGRVQCTVGRGTFVAGEPPTNGRSTEASAAHLEIRLLQTMAWRRRTLSATANRLRISFPDALDCTSGKPNVDLLPLEVVRRAVKEAADALTASDLQYWGPEPIQPLVERLLPVLEADGIPANGSDILVGSSAQQWMVLSCRLLAESQPKLTLAVEEPGYPTILDTFDRMRVRLVGLDLDEYGATPESLDRVLRAGARGVLFVPRGQNPTGASWTRERRAALADVLAAHPGVVAIEDDQVADVSNARYGSLLSDHRIADRVIYIRSFSKTIAADLRIAVAVARGPLCHSLKEAKNFADGWTPRLTQNILARILGDEELGPALAAARDTYRRAREALVEALNAVLKPNTGSACPGCDSVNTWVHLPPEADCMDVVERAAAAGVLVAPGEPFFLQAGNKRCVRLSAGHVKPDEAPRVAEALADAIKMSVEATALFHV